jgi:hypothetical protein
MKFFSENSSWIFLIVLAISISAIKGDCPQLAAKEDAMTFDKKEELKNRLTSVFMLFRHGARTPNKHTTSGYIQNNLIQPGMLTPVGEQQLRALGERAFKKYDIFEPKDVLFISSFRDRNVFSLENFIMTYKEKISTKGYSEDAIRIFYTHKDSDFLFHSQYFDKRFKAKRDEIAEEFKVKIDSMYEIAESLGVEKLLKEYYPIYETINAAKKLSALSHLYTIMRCNQVNEIDNPNQLDPKLMKLLEYAFSFQMYQVNYKQENFRRRRTNEILILLGKQILSILKPFDNYNALYYKYFTKFSNTIYEVEPAMFLSAHDTNIMGILSTMLEDTELTNDKFFIPDFAGYLKFELIDNNEKDYFVELGHGIEGNTKTPNLQVKIKYYNHEIFMKRCGNKRCDVQSFIEFLNENTNDCHSHECIRDIDIENVGEFKSAGNFALI